MNIESYPVSGIEYKAISIFKLLLFLFFFFISSTQAQTEIQKKWTLIECIDRALDKNIYINQNKLSNQIDKLTLDQSKYNRLPNLNFSGGQNFSYGRSIDPYTNLYVDQNISSDNISLTSNVTLYNGLQNENTIRMNQKNFEAGKADVEVAQNEISLNVVAAYLQVLLAYEQVDNARSQVDATTVEVDRTKKYFDVGKFPESSLLQIQSQLATDKYSLVITENQLQNSKVVLMQLIELPVTDSFEIEKPDLKEILQPVNYSTDEIFKTAMGILPEVKSAVMKTESSEIDLKIMKGMQMPKLTLGGTLKTSYSSSSSLTNFQTLSSNEQIGYLQNNPSEIVIGPTEQIITSKQDYPFKDQYRDNYNKLINLSLFVPIFNGRQVKTSIEKAKINSDIAQLNEQSVKNQLRKNIELAVTDLKAAEKKYTASNDEYNAEETSYQNMEKKFTLGMVSSTDFLVEKNNFIKAKSNVIQAKYDYIFKIKVVDYYMGKPLTF